jgi:hypothetical protein
MIQNNSKIQKYFLKNKNKQTLFVQLPTPTHGRIKTTPLNHYIKLSPHYLSNPLYFSPLRYTNSMIITWSHGLLIYIINLY